MKNETHYDQVVTELGEDGKIIWENNMYKKETTVVDGSMLWNVYKRGEEIKNKKIFRLRMLAASLTAAVFILINILICVQV